MANLLLWAVAEKWFYPHLLPTEWGFAFWRRVFSPRSVAWEELGNSVLVAICTVLASLALAIPAGYALARLALPARGVILLVFLIPQAFPNLMVYVNIARLFYQWGLNGTLFGVVLVRTVHGLVFTVWIVQRRLLLSDARWNRPLAPLGPARGVRLSISPCRKNFRG